MHYTRFGLLLQMSYVAWSVCLSLCALATRMCCVITGELIEMPFGEPTLVDPRHHVLDGSQDRMNLFAVVSNDM